MVFQSAPHRVQRLMQQKRYLTAVNTLNKAITVMFGEDLVGVSGLSALREQLMDMKETMLETCVTELKSAVVGMHVLYSCIYCVWYLLGPCIEVM